MPESRAMKQKLHEKLGVSPEQLSRKIQKVKHDDPGLTNRQAAGKAAGIIEGQERGRGRGRGR